MELKCSPRLPRRNVVLLIREGEETEGREWIDEGGRKGGKGKRGRKGGRGRKGRFASHTILDPGHT